MKYTSIIVVLVFFAQGVFAQKGFEDELSCFHAKSRISAANLKRAKAAFPGDENIDVNYYFLDISIEPTSRLIKGAVRIDYLPLVDALTSVSLDLNNAYQVDSIKDENGLLSFSHTRNVITITVPEKATLGAVPSKLMVYYQGEVPQTNGGELGMQFTTHGNNVPVVWTLSEPFDAPLWWPCVDNPADKADSCDVWVTMPSFYTAVSQGILEEIKVNDDGTNTAKWKHRYPISQYLISIAASNYELKKREFLFGENGRMDVLDYIYPEIARNADLENLLGTTVDMLKEFSEVYGEYPFIKEKYGHAMFGFGGGMEHQTISSMGGFSTGLIAHELAHQWFGDKVTCKTWRDIWVNEGFAEFSALYYYERANGREEYDARVAFHMDAAKGTSGSIAIQNPTSVSAIFNFPLTYQKGSVVLHTLRGILGNDIFFKTLKEFQNTEFAYGAASIEDFQSVAERVTGLELSYFFEQWILGTGYPKYTLGWVQNEDNTLQMNISHTTTGNVPTFTIPMEVEIFYSDGTTEIQTIFVDQNEISIELSDVKPGITSVVLDPNSWIIKDLETFKLNSGVLAAEKAIDLTLYPNPASEVLKIKGKGLFEMDVIDGTGRVFTKSSGEAINVKNLPSGRFFVRFKDSENRVFVKSFVKQ